MRGFRILIIDDDSKLVDLLRDYLARFRMDVLGAGDAESGLAVLERERPSLIVLDVMLPARDGFETCRDIRRRSNVPIIMLSARGESVDRIVGLELGADDYLPKPFEPRELVTRIQAVLRRTGAKAEASVLRFEGLEINIGMRDAFYSGRPAGLSSMEFELLLLLAQHPGRKFTRDEIMNHLQGVDSRAFSRSTDVLISRIRAKIHDDPKRPRFVRSVRSVGYVFHGEPA
jgi:two-component system, OmpR family, phosphate regulon response regulator OmpR